MNEQRVIRLLREADEDRDGASARLEALLHEYSLERNDAFLQVAFVTDGPSVRAEPWQLIDRTLRTTVRKRRAHHLEPYFRLFSRVELRALSELMTYRRLNGQAGRVTFRLPATGHKPSIDLGLEPFCIALQQLDAFDGRKADVVRLTAIWNESPDRIGALLGIEAVVVETDWSFARIWFDRAIGRQTDERAAG